ncbi:PQQ-dependent sugar dehydrogenase [Mucilaginibacter daejeonensis]|uniref:PQQ-dependent sugar dehydrogenase n=1 Tax=Mucilaginibacter daejeonensis TaxID=398049 RepID=UPI001D16FE69|nr:PQQ-dependent sugar dehydrogenase [Mucilaginibacter daejeonensis]UEG51806.1 PQQ-dependent sugar dehydrogenase [Mucilaginibacter daejeonensis]
MTITNPLTIMMPKVLTIALLSSALLLSTCSKNSSDNGSQAGNADLDAKVLTDRLTFPWEILWGPDNMLWMTERGGKISRVDPSNGQVSPLVTVPDVKAQGEGGLLGMVLHPDFGSTPQVFVAYNYDKNGTYTEKIVRYTYSGGTLNSPVVLLDNIPAANNHNGCRLAISPDRKLFITTGDATSASQAQNAGSLSGKILRLNLDGSIPSDNPTSGNPIWTLGHRNPQGLVFANDRLYSSEHGNTTDDEVNIIQKGRNYGWPNVEGYCSTGNEPAFCSTNNVAEPIQAWSPTIAPSGIDYYNNDAIPQWKNSLLLAVLKDSQLLQLKLSASSDKVETVNPFYKGTYGRMRDVAISPDGKVYIITSNGGATDKIVVVSKK